MFISQQKTFNQLYITNKRSAEVGVPSSSEVFKRKVAYTVTVGFSFKNVLLQITGIYSQFNICVRIAM